MLQQIKIQFLDDLGKKLIGHIRHNHPDASALVGPEADGIGVGSETTLLNGPAYLFFRFPGVSSVMVDDPLNRCG